MPKIKIVSLIIITLLLASCTTKTTEQKNDKTSVLKETTTEPTREEINQAGLAEQEAQGQINELVEKYTE